MNSFYSQEEIEALGFKSVGKNVLLSKKTSVYGAENISVGNDVRIDDFCILSGNISIGSYIHIAAYSGLYGGAAGITVENFANISSRVCIYAISDDYSGKSLTNPMVPDEYKCLDSRPVRICKHSIIGSGSTVLPGIIIAEGTAIGAMCLVNNNTEPWNIYVGIPIHRIKERERTLLALEKDFLEKERLK